MVPCDAITIPVVRLSAWQEVSPYNYHHRPPYSAISSLYPRQRKLVKPFQFRGSGPRFGVKYGK